MTRTPLHPVYREIGKRIKDRREACNMKQTALASVIGFANSTSISEIEKGKVRIQFDVLLSIAQILDCPVSTLLPEYVHSEEITEYRELEYPELFENKTLATLHDAFLRASSILSGMKHSDEHYWEMVHASENILKAMGEIEDAAYQWRSFLGTREWERPEQEEIA
jgi:transcriptional regulator with XRE-family HTH domain